MINTDTVVEKPAASTSGELPQQLRGAVSKTVRPLFSYPAGPNVDHWVFEVGTLPAATSQDAVFPSFADQRSRPLLQSFIEVNSLSTLVNGIRGAALDVFGSAATLTENLRSDPESGADFLRIDIGVRGVERGEYRHRKELFNERLDHMPGGARFDTVVVTVTRIA